MISLEERKEFLWKELNKLPNREVCKCATIKEIIRILQEVNVKDAREVFEDFEINLTVSEIPDGQIFETILYFLLAPEWNEDFLVYDEYIWNLSDEETKKRLEEAKEVLEIDFDEELCNILLSEFLEYAKSDKPDI